MTDANQMWTVARVVENYLRLGVPHFQRGLVWPESSVARLLESLYYDTPCGNLILWKPRDPQAEGVPLPADQAAGCDTWGR